MDTETFMNVVIESQVIDLKVLMGKASEYTSGGNRLAQFGRAAELKDTNPIIELVGMATKHFISIDMMAEAPNMHSLALWREKTTDLRNYMHLLEGLLIDMEVE